MSATAAIALLWIAACAHGVGALLLVLRPRAGRMGWMVATFAAACHLTALFVRAAAADRLPVQNLFEAMCAAALCAAVAGLMMGARWRDRGPVMAGSLCAGLALAGALTLPVPGRSIEPEAPILSTAPLLAWHVGAVLIAYGLIAMGGALSAAYLWRARAARGGEGSRLALARLSAWQLSMARAAFLVLGVGVLLGAWWAHLAWGRWWGWDPKETWALITWGVLLVAVHVPCFAKAARAESGGAMVAWLNILALMLMLWSAFGVNLLFPGLHSYAGS